MAIKNAIRVALKGIDQQINPQIVEEIKKYAVVEPVPEPRPAV